MKHFPRAIWLPLMILVLIIAACSGTASEEEDFALTGVTWQWITLTENTPDGGTIQIANPPAYTLTFNEDGTLNGRADCNDFFGSYIWESNGIQITLGPSTMAFCGEESLDQLYLGTLAQVATGGPDGTGNLALESAGAAQRMVFSAP
jgi:heat shock protein HslJ